MERSPQFVTALGEMPLDGSEGNTEIGLETLGIPLG